MEDQFTILIIDTNKVRDMDIFDVPGAYFNADMTKDKCIILNTEGEFVDIMCEVNPEQRENIIIEMA